MPWVRIDDHAMEHPKVAGLPDGAFRLWVAGLSYCQKYLTDGFISDVALRGLRAFTPKRRGELLAAGLWRDAQGGITVHDYLDWNDSRAHVLSSREQARERLKKHKEKRVSKDVQNVVENAHPTVGGYVRGSTQILERRTEPEKPVGPVGVASRRREQDEISERAGRFVQETYPALYAKHRKGARYISKPTLDFQEALELCRVWDDERLAKIATVFLTTDHHFAENGSRTMAQFRSMASWCDGKLAEAGIA
jgi:hypothetical protein